MDWRIIVTLVLVACIMIPLFIFLVTGIMGAPYVPSEAPDIRKAFTELYALSDKDLLIDFGSGDGTVPQIATEYGAKAIGIDINPILVWFSRHRLSKNKNLKIKNANMYRYRLPKETTVIYMYMLPQGLESAYRHIKKEATRLDKTLYLISNAFDLKKIKPIEHSAPLYLYKITPEKHKD